MPEPEVRDASQELIEELMGAVVAVDFVLQTLMACQRICSPAKTGRKRCASF
jgi:hypothetical protein